MQCQLILIIHAQLTTPTFIPVSYCSLYKQHDIEDSIDEAEYEVREVVSDVLPSEPCWDIVRPGLLAPSSGRLQPVSSTAE